MRLLLITLTCLAASLALPQPKQKRDILPGDPRYGTDHHQHHHENVVSQVNSLGGYSYSAPLDTYGPPGYEPGTPLNNEYLTPVDIKVDVKKYSTPVPSFGVPDTVHVPEVTKIYSVPELKETVSSTTVSIPVQTYADKYLEPVTPPSTSYGVPVVKNVKTTVKTGVLPLARPVVKTVKTEVPASVNVVEHTVPTVQGGTHLNGRVQALPTVTTVRKNVYGNTLLSQTLPSAYESYREVLDVPSYDLSSYVPPTLYSSDLSSFNPVRSGYGNVNLNYPLTSFNRGAHLDFPSSYPLYTQVIKSIPTAYSFPQTVQVPETSLHVPHSLTQIVQRVRPATSSVYSLPPVSHVESVAPVQSDYTLDTLTPVETVETQPPLHHVHTVESVKSVETVTPVQHTVKTVQHVPSVKTVKTVTPVEPSSHSLESVETVSKVHPVESVKTVTTVEPVKSLEILTPPHPVSSTLVKVIKTQTPTVVQTHAQVQKGPISDFFQNISGSLPEFPSFPSFPSLPSLPSFPSLPSLSSLTGSPTTVATPVEEDSPSNGFLHSNGVTIETPLLSNEHLVKSVTPVNEYVQPTDANGGYVY